VVLLLWVKQILHNEKSTYQVLIVGGSKVHPHKLKMADGCHLAWHHKNYLGYALWPSVVCLLGLHWRKLSTHCGSSKNAFYKSKMANKCHPERNEKLLCLSNCLSDFDDLYIVWCLSVSPHCSSESISPLSHRGRYLSNHIIIIIIIHLFANKWQKFNIK